MTNISFGAYYEKDDELLCIEDSTEHGEDMVTLRLSTHDVVEGRARRVSTGTLRLALSPENALRLVDALAAALAKLATKETTAA